jgi:hypothetical protein
MSNLNETKIKELFNSIYLTKSIQDLIDNHPDRKMNPQTHFDYMVRGQACIQMLMHHMMGMDSEQAVEMEAILDGELDDAFVNMFEMEYEFEWDKTAPVFPEMPIKKKGKKSKKNSQL